MKKLRDAAQQALAALENTDGKSIVDYYMSNCSTAIEVLRAALVEPDLTIKESKKVHASAEEYLRYRYGAYRGHFAWRELAEAYSQGRYDEEMAQGPCPWPDSDRNEMVNRLRYFTYDIPAANALMLKASDMLEADAHPESDPVAFPDTCDGKEQEAWEDWAKSEKYDMSQHPLHYLFLNELTYSARDGWKGGLLYAVGQMKKSAPVQPDYVPLTDEQIDSVLSSTEPSCWDVPLDATNQFARAIERAVRGAS